MLEEAYEISYRKIWPNAQFSLIIRIKTKKFFLNRRLAIVPYVGQKCSIKQHGTFIYIYVVGLKFPIFFFPIAL